MGAYLGGAAAGALALSHVEVLALALPPTLILLVASTAALAFRPA
jgi:hypothetical protein